MNRNSFPPNTFAWLKTKVQLEPNFLPPLIGIKNYENKYQDELVEGFAETTIAYLRHSWKTKKYAFDHIQSQNPIPMINEEHKLVEMKSH